MSDDKHDPVTSPAHYDFEIQPIDAIESWGLDYHLGNAVKYIARAAHKGAELEDLRKAEWYLRRAILRRAGVGPGWSLDIDAAPKRTWVQVRYESCDGEVAVRDGWRQPSGTWRIPGIESAATVIAWRRVGS